MKIDQLSYFLEAARQQHIGKAAKVLAISPSAISHSIASLEQELARELFVKKGKNIILTSHGKLLMERSQKILRDLEIIREELAADEVPLEGHYKFAASHFLCSHHLMPVWAEMQNENPELVGEVFTLRSAQVVSGVASGEFDLGLCFSPLSHPDLICQPLYSGQLLVAIAKDHPLLKKKPHERISALNHYPAVLPKAYQGIDVCERHPVFEKFKIQPRPDCLIDSYEVAVEKVAHSLSWGFLPDWVIKPNSDRIQILKCEGWKAPYTISIVRLKHRFVTKVLERLIAGLSLRFTPKSKPPSRRNQDRDANEESAN